MANIHIIHGEHKDVIHDISFTYYGDRMATCSKDQYVKVWDIDEKSRNWTLTSSWKAHNGSVWKVTWANPDFGQILATCSFDRTVSIWEELCNDTFKDGALITTRHWVRRANLVDSTKSVTDVKFSPLSFGLVLATCSEDGILRIYEVLDIMAISEWSLQYQVPLTIRCSCLAWNPLLSINSIPKSMIAVGSNDTNTTNCKLFLCEYNKVSCQWTKTKSVCIKQPVHDVQFAPNMGRPFYLLGVATKNVHVLKIKHIIDSTSSFPYTIETIAKCEDLNSSVWRLAWNVTGTVLASSSSDRSVRLWKSIVDTWNCVIMIKHGQKFPQPKSQDSPFLDQNDVSKYMYLSQITHPSEVYNRSLTYSSSDSSCDISDGPLNCSNNDTRTLTSTDDGCDTRICCSDDNSIGIVISGDAHIQRSADTDAHTDIINNDNTRTLIGDDGDAHIHFSVDNDTVTFISSDAHMQSSSNIDTYTHIRGNDEANELVWNNSNICELIDDFDSNIHIQGDDVSTHGSSNGSN